MAVPPSLLQCLRPPTRSSVLRPRTTQLVQGRSYPSDELLRNHCHYLDLDFDEALMAANADRIEQRYGTSDAYATIREEPKTGGC